MVWLSRSDLPVMAVCGGAVAMMRGEKFGFGWRGEAVEFEIGGGAARIGYGGWEAEFGLGGGASELGCGGWEAEVGRGGGAA